jgi:hypothetical protein
MVKPALRVGGEVSIIGKDVFRAFELFQLDQKAAMANAGMERIKGLGLTQLLASQKRVGERGHP